MHVLADLTAWQVKADYRVISYSWHIGEFSQGALVLEAFTSAPGGRHAPPRQPQQQRPPTAAERSAGRPAAASGDAALVPGHPGHRLPDHGRPGQPGQLRLLKGPRLPFQFQLYINQSTSMCLHEQRVCVFSSVQVRSVT